MTFAWHDILRNLVFANHMTFAVLHFAADDVCLVDVFALLVQNLQASTCYASAVEVV